MTRIGLISDTHGTLESKLFNFFSEVEEIWHAGDIGGIEIADRLKKFKPLRAVYGNIDDQKTRAEYPRENRFFIEEVDVWITHIGGYPGKYDSQIRERISQNPPNLFIAGHSHILKVQHDPNLDLLHINPGAIGNSGFHRVKTAVRFIIEGNNIKDLEVLELPRR